MNSTRRTILATCLALGAMLGAGTTASAERTMSYLAPEKEMEGTIQQLDFGANTMIFEGIRFHMAPDLQVEIRGTYGAFTMLSEGMKALVSYRVLSESAREAFKIEQLPDNMDIEALPTAQWGYFYFPTNVRYIRTHGVTSD